MHLTPRATRIFATLFLAGLFNAQLTSTVVAHEAQARAGHKEGGPTLDVETDFFFGQHGYLHMGAGVTMSLKEEQRLGLIYHTVREETGGSYFPSLGAEYTRKFANGLEVESFSFGYFPVEDKSAWAVGARVSKEIEVSESFVLIPFFGPTWARVRAYDETADTARDVDYLMLFGGVTATYQALEMSVFGNYSFFSRNPEELETPLDLEEMTHFAIYENNDGFARGSVGTDISYTVTPWLSATARYAAIYFPDEPVVQSISAVARFTINEHLSIFAGPQWIRGSARDNNLVAAGFSVTF